MKKKLLATLLVLTMVLSGCGQSAPEKEESKTSAPAASSTEASKPEATETKVGEEEELPYVKLKYVNIQAKPESGNYDQVWAKINEMLLEDLNCEIEIEFLGSTDKSALALKYAVNEVFDMAYDASWIGYADNAKANAYRPITMEEVHEYMPLIEEQLPAVGWEQSKVDGNIYMIPNVNVEYSTCAVLIRGDLREKYGLEPVKTLEDYTEYLYAVAENEKGIEALASCVEKEKLYEVNAYNMRSVSGMTTYRPNFYYLLDEALDGKYEIFYAPLSENRLENYKFYQEMYEKGVWAADAISDSTAYLTKLENGLAASSITNISTCNTYAKNINAAHPEWKMEICYLNEGMLNVTNSFTGNGTTINRNAENPERAMMAINLLYGDPEYNHLLNYGLEGVNYEINADGKRVALEAAPEDTYTPGCNWNFQNTVIGIPAVTDYPGVQEIRAAFQASTVEDPLNGFSFDKSSVETEIASISAVESEYLALEYGMIENLEETMKKYEDALMAAGLQKVLDEANRQLAEFVANK